MTYQAILVLDPKYCDAIFESLLRKLSFRSGGARPVSMLTRYSNLIHISSNKRISKAALGVVMHQVNPKPERVSNKSGQRIS